jgi:DNA-binding response OmpR family regulator
MEHRILIIDDDRELCALLADFLSLEGFAVSAIHHGAEAIAHCRSHDYDALILDVMLPGRQGLDLLRDLRRFSSLPVLMLTARGEDTDRIVGLELGADDYLPKPCNPRELAARLRAILRRAAPEDGGPPRAQQVGALQLNGADRSAVYRDAPLSLTTAEFNLLQVLMSSAGDAVHKEDLSRQALGRPLSAYDRSVDVHISKIRKKLAAAGADQLILSVRGVGYQLADAPPESRQ